MGSQSGPNPGRANGSGSSFTEEQTTFKRDKINATTLNPRGRMIGKLDIKGPSKRGEATFQVSTEVRQAVQELTEEVEKEPLPIEHRRHLQRYLGILGGEAPPEGDGE